MNHTPGFVYFIALFRIATQFGIGSQSRHRVTRHFYFGYNVDIPLAGIFHYFTYLILGIKSAIRRIVKLLRIAVMIIADDSLRPLTSYFGQPGIFFYLDTPSLVIG